MLTRSPGASGNPRSAPGGRRNRPHMPALLTSATPARVDGPKWPGAGIGVALVSAPALSRALGGRKLLLLAPDSLARQPPGVRRDHLMDRVGSPRARWIHLHRRRVGKQRCRALPEALDALGGGEQGVVIAHRVHDQPLVRLQHVV